jgi:pantoate--beta-alanine ligase
MKIVTTVEEMKKIGREHKSKGLVIGLVPTMGYLHEGHLTLMKEAREKCDLVVASIFVNPIQFGVNEDYDQYPRDLERDSQLAETAGVDVIFAPTVKEMYPENFQTFVSVEQITNVLCGAKRPGHFKGVTTVVNKLFNIVQADYAFFGQKDAQQVLVIKKMVEDLNMNLEIKMVPIVRESDGLALSSRNKYLSQEERKTALVLSRSLNNAERVILSGEKDTSVIISMITEAVNHESLAKVDYIEIKTWPDLKPVAIINGQVLVALAVYIGYTRLIDNLVVEVH